MLQKHSHWIVATSWAAAAAGIWVVAVPTWMSATTFGWVNGAALGIGVVVVASVRSMRPTESIARILYETEHPATPSR
jgi:hypothetical protein